MDFKQLEAFVAVARCGSFSRAGDELYLSQPTVSAHIKNLEAELSVRLLERTTKEVLLSNEGRRFLSYACAMLEMRESAVCAVKEQPLYARKTIRVAASSVPEQFILPELIGAFLKVRPDVSFNILKGDSRQVSRFVALREADIGFAGTICDTQRCDWREFAPDELVLIAPDTEKNRRLAKNGITADRLYDFNLIMREEGSGTRREFELYLQNNSADFSRLKTAATLSDTLAIMRLAESGVGVGIVSLRAAQSFKGACVIIRFAPKGLKRSLYTVTRKARKITGAAADFLKFIYK